MGIKSAGTIQQLYGAFLRVCMHWFYLCWRNECDMILLSVEFVIYMEEYFGRE